MICIIHKWGKWRQYQENIPARQITENWGLSAAIEYRQVKMCDKCGKAKDELIKTKVM